MTLFAGDVFLFVFLFGVNCRGQERFESKSLDYHPNKILILPDIAQTQSLQVSHRIECFEKCTSVDWCQSGNFKTTPENNGLHVCELLSSDRFTESNSLSGNHSYLHFDIKTICHINNKPCLNGGECIQEGLCKCKYGFSGEQCDKKVPGSSPDTASKTCKDLHQIEPSIVSGIHWINPSGTNAFKAYCDMETEGGGWTLVYTYNFANYGNFGHGSNAVNPQPTWPTNSNIPKSSTPPLSESQGGAIDYNLWKTIGNEFVIKSNINHWIKCQEQTGSLVNWRAGSVTCNVIKNVAPVCHNYAPNLLSFNSLGALLDRGSGFFKTYYFFEGSTTSMNWPTHDPCGSNRQNHVKGVANPHGNIYIR